MITEMNRKALNSVSMIPNAKESKLEYEFYIFSFKLFYNDFISAYFTSPLAVELYCMYQNILRMCSSNIFYFFKGKWIKIVYFWNI